MFSHKGKTRTEKHNLAIASLLSFVAGLVNVVGFFSVNTLTTNVTGHFAFFIDEAFHRNVYLAFNAAFYVFSFFVGAFFSSFVVEIYLRQRENLMFVIPTLVEAFILIGIGLSGSWLVENNPDIVAFALLFAMGMQNALVTTISNAVVRTTHLTGLFTDMGIEFSQLFFYRDRANRIKLLKSIRLRLTIIWMFFAGGIAGGYLHSEFGLNALLFSAFLLLAGLLLDFIKIRILLRRHANNV